MEIAAQGYLEGLPPRQADGCFHGGHHFGGDYRTGSGGEGAGSSAPLPEKALERLADRCLDSASGGHVTDLVYLYETAKQPGSRQQCRYRESTRYCSVRQ